MDFENYIPVTKHYLERFRKRIARSTRIPYFATCAYENGIKSEDIESGELRRFMQEKSELHSNQCILKLYKGYIHVFDNILHTAITVYRVPNHFLVRM